jgi:hypothetical protein
MLQKEYNCTCPKCNQSFTTTTYTTFHIETQGEELFTGFMSVKASPCPYCQCGTPIPKEFNWRKYETNTTDTHPGTEMESAYPKTKYETDDS